MITLKLIDVVDNREVKSLDINGAKEQIVEYEMTALLPGTYKCRSLFDHILMNIFVLQCESSPLIAVGKMTNNRL
jgi:hypothetical protein